MTEPSIPAETRIGHVHLKVADLERAIGFYRDYLGFDLLFNLGSAAFLSAGGYHHHIGLNTWESKDGPPPAPGTTGLYHQLSHAQRPGYRAQTPARSWLVNRRGLRSWHPRGHLPARSGFQWDRIGLGPAPQPVAAQGRVGRVQPAAARLREPASRTRGAGPGGIPGCCVCIQVGKGSDILTSVVHLHPIDGL